MEKDINLLTVERKSEKKVNSFFSISLFTLLAIVFVAVACILYLLFLKNQIASISNAQTSVLSNIQGFDSQRAKLLTIKERLSVINKIIPGNQVLSQRMQLIKDSIPAGFVVDDVSADGIKITITMSSPSLSSFNTFLNSDLSGIPNKKNAGIKNIQIQGFGLSPAKTSYDARIEFTFNTIN